MRTKLEVLQDTLESLGDVYLLAGSGKPADERVENIVEHVDGLIETLGQEIQNEHATN